MTDSGMLFRALPSMDAALTALADEYAPVVATLPRPMLRDIAETFFNTLRSRIREGEFSDANELALSRLLPELARFVEHKGRPHFRRVLNGSGVVVHTNLGRSLLAPEAAEAAKNAALNYNNLEFDLENGERGSRYAHVEDLLIKLTGAESALAVNNNAAAVLLVLDTVAKGREVIVSRGELVEIGGSFRIPAVMEKSGCILRETGTTNRTHPEDYEKAITEETAALLKVHTSNYRIIGFHREVSLAELAPLAARHGLPLIEDLGSGNLYDFGAHGFSHLADEPTVAALVREGADIITFSGDKILGGPQAGIIVGKKEWIGRIKKNPLTRALRVDKMTLAALECTLRLYADPDLAARKIPTLRMLLMDEGALRRRAVKLKNRLHRELGGIVELSLLPGNSRVGGGSFPEKDLPTCLVRLVPASVSATRLRDALLAVPLPLVGRLEDDALCLDPRTLDDEEFGPVARSLRDALQNLA